MKNRIDELMKPFMDKIDELKKERNGKVTHLRLQLERLKANKESEIEEYLREYVSENTSSLPNPNYREIVKRDLENAYLAKEKALQDEINNTPDYTNVYLYELGETQDKYRKIIYQEKKRLEFDIEEADIRFQVALHSLRAFKYEYDENHNITEHSRNKYKALSERSQACADRLSRLKLDMQKLEEYEKIVKTSPRVLLEVGGPETLQTLTPWEKDYYEKRKAEREKTSAPTPVPAPTPEPTPAPAPSPAKDPEKKDPKDPTAPVKPTDPKKDPKPVPVSEDLADVIVDNSNALINQVYEDIMSGVDEIQTIKLSPRKDATKRTLSTVIDGEVLPQAVIDLKVGEEEIVLPNGEYVNRKDFNKALQDYYKKNKGKIYYVKETDEKLSLSKKALRKLKRTFKLCSIIELLKNKKITETDVRRVIGKENAYKNGIPSMYAELSSNLRLSEYDYVDNGEYVSVSDVKENLEQLFSEKRKGWLKRIKENLLSRKKEKSDEEEIEVEKPAKSR